MFGKKAVKLDISDDARRALVSLDGDVKALTGMVAELVTTHTRILEIVRGELQTQLREMDIGEEEEETILVVPTVDPVRQPETNGEEPPWGERTRSAEDSLRQQMSEGGWHRAATLIQHAVEAGHKRKTVERAAANLEVERRRNPDGTMSWRLRPELRIVEPEEKPKEEPNGLPEAMQFTEPEKIHVSEEDRVRSTPFTRAPRSTQVDWLREVMADGDWYAATTIARTYATDERHYRYMRGAVTSRLKEMHEEGLVERRDSRVRGSMFEYRLREEK